MTTSSSSPSLDQPRRPSALLRQRPARDEGSASSAVQMTPTSSTLTMSASADATRGQTAADAVSPNVPLQSVDEQRALHERSRQASPSTSRDHAAQDKSGQRAGAGQETSADASTLAHAHQTDRSGRTKSSRDRDRNLDRKSSKAQMSRNISTMHLGEAASTSAMRSSAHDLSRTGPGRSSRGYHVRSTPQLPSAPNVKQAPPPAMYWSKTPVHGMVPRRSFRAHSATLADEILWLFGGCDAKGCFQDLWCFDTGV